MSDKKTYSDWLKIDLHIHTDLSKKTKSNDYKGNFDVTTLKSKLIQNEVQIFSLTDHNIINIPAYKDYYNNCIESDPFLLLGVELDILVKDALGSQKTYHSLLIFKKTGIEYVKLISQKLEDKYSEKELDFENRKLDIDEVSKLFKDEDFFFIPHAGNNKSIVASYSHDIKYAQTMVLLMNSAFEKVDEKRRQKYSEGFNNVLMDSFKNQKDIPFIEFSDNHNIEKYPCRHKGTTGQHNFYYIKGGKNYETIRLAFIDPESRIKSTEEYLSLQGSENYIEKIKIEGEDFIEDVELSFSPHLNVLIGGRSSGKSLMMSIFAKKIDSLSHKLKDKYSINYENFKIKTSLSSIYTNEASYSKDEIIFLSQGDIVKYFEENKLHDLAIETGRQTEYGDARLEVANYKQYILNNLTELIDLYSNSYNSLQQKNILHSKTINDLSSEDYILIFDIDLVRESFDAKSKLEEIDTLLKRLNLDSEKLKTYDFLELSDLEKKDIEKFEEILKVKGKLISKKKILNRRKLDYLSEIEIIINTKNQSLSLGARQKQDANDRLKNLLLDIDKIFYFSSLLKNQSLKIQKINPSFSKSIRISEDIQLSIGISGDDLVPSILEGIIDSNLGKSFYINLYDLILYRTKIKRHSSNDSISLKKKIHVQLLDYLEGFNASEDYLIYSDGTTSRNNSPGFNSEKYLEIILKSENIKVIFIDQPEDNLGNKFISQNLVSILRDIKFKKQIFLVTHNPSVVVHGDTESVIISNNKEGKISYHQIVLEDTTSQKEICDILDGGKYIFNKRSEKYNIKRLIEK
jgi:hypothetical protein